MSKKILALFMAAAMAFSLLPVTVFAANEGEESGAATPPDVLYGHYTGEGNTTWTQGKQERTDRLTDTVTTVDKTATKVDGQDNQYEVSLKVQMKYKSTEVQPGAAATVLVMDKSGSMNYCTDSTHTHSDNCGNENGRSSRLAAAKTAAINFLKSYSGFSDSDFDSNGELKSEAADKNLNRYVSLVTFNTSADLQKWGNWWDLDKNKQSWLDVSTRDGYNNLFKAINEITAGGGTNLDAALRLAKTQMQSGSIEHIEKNKKNVIVLTDGVPTYYVETYKNVEQHGDSGCPDTNSVTTTSATSLKTDINALYTVCFGAAGQKCWTEGSVHKKGGKHIPDKKHTTDGPTVGDFLKDSIATQPATGSQEQYAYDANDANKLYEAFAAITESITDGLKEGVVTDGLPTGVTAVEGNGFTERWELNSDAAMTTTDGDYTVYTYTKTYRVNVDPATVNTVEVSGVNYAPLNTPTTLTVKDSNNQDVKIPFPIPAGKVTYSLTSFNKELVTAENKDSTLNIPEGVTIPETATSSVEIGDSAIILLYKITVSGNLGAKFVVTDSDATLVAPQDNSITVDTTNSTFSGTVGDSGTVVFYVNKNFTKQDIASNGETKTISNTAIISPGDNTKGLDDPTKTVTTTVTESAPTPGTYTVIYQWATGKETPSDAALPEGNPFTLSVGETHTVATTPTSSSTTNSKGETGTWTCSWDKSGVIEGNAGGQVVITGTWTFTKQEIEPTPDQPKPEVNKTATDLVNDKTDVTLSIGGKSAKENVAVMFLLDKSTSQGETRPEAARMLQYLKSLTNTNIIYDVVIFSGKATSTGWRNISDDNGYEDTLQNFANKETSSGTNMTAGIDQALKDMETLKSEYSSYTENTYLVTISDGITYVWDEDGQTKTVPFQQQEGSNIYETVYVNVETWDMMYGQGVSIGQIYTSFENFLNEIPKKMNQTREDKHVRDYNLTEDSDVNVTPIVISTTDPQKSEVSQKYACAPEFSVYYSATRYQELVKQFAKSFALPMPELKDGADNTDNWDKLYPWGRELMLYLQSNSSNSGQGVVHDADAATIFAGIRDEILYEIKSGSITDVIGADFSLTDQTLTKDTFTLTVNGKAVTANQPDGNVVTFGEANEDGQYPYVLTYYKGTAAKNADNTYTITSGNKTYTYTPCDTTSEINGSVSDEFFVLEMNVPVVSLELKYNLSLTSKQTAAGTYTVPTNESATLKYQPANGREGSVDFNEPTVSYTVKRNNGGSGGSSRPTLNTKDHYGYIIGYPVDYYTGEPTTDQTKKPVRPEGKITRAEVATIYFRMLTDESRTKFWSQSNAYSDVKAGDWFNNAVSTLSNAGIIAGYEDGSFRPNGYITRAEFATIAARFFDATYNGKDLFPDIDGHWAKDYINKAADKGFVNGYEDGTFRPDRNITRAEAVTLVNRTLDRHPDKNYFTKDMLVWPDNMDTTKWYYADMQEATNSHKYQMLTKSDKTQYEKWTQTLPIRNWEALEKAWSNANSSQGTGNVV